MFNETKYGIVYIKIIEKAKSYNRIKLSKNDIKYHYYEEHHIVPRSIDENLIFDKNNLVLLTAREHFICHLLLWKHFKKLNNIRNERKMSKAIRQLNNNGKYNSKIYESLKLNLSHSQESKDKISKNNKSGTEDVRTKLRLANLGKKQSKETIEKRKNTMDNRSDRMKTNHSKKLSNSLKGRVKPEGSGMKKGFKHGPEFGKRISELKKGTILSEGHKKKISTSLKGKPKPYYEYSIYNNFDELILDLNITDFPHNFKQTTKEKPYKGGQKKNRIYKGWYVSRILIVP